MHKRVVLMVIPNLTFGGAQRVFYNLSIELSRHYRVVECVFNVHDGHAFRSGNEVRSLDVDGGTNLISKVWQFILRCKRLRELKKSLQADVCISHLEGADLVNVLSGGTARTITWVHGSKKHDRNIEGLLGFIRHKFLIPLTYRRADKVITVSSAIADELAEHYRVNKNRTETIHNYFDVEDIVTKSKIPLAPSFGPVFEDRQTLIFSGRLARQKNPAFLLKWFASFTKTYPCKLVIVGDGELRESLLELCEALTLKTYSVWTEQTMHQHYEVYFLGFQENPFQFLKHASLFILPSSWEGFPMVIGEAMACGVPVASADCPTGPKEMLMENGFENINYPCMTTFGLLLPLLDENGSTAWTAGVSEILSRKDLLDHYAEQGARRVRDFSSSLNSKRIVALIESVCA